MSSVKLCDLSPGELFEYNGTIALKSEYHSGMLGNTKCECYIVGSGEFFWGGTDNPKDLNNLLVNPITLEGAALLVNALRLSDENRARLIASLFVRTDNWQHIVNEINRMNEVGGRELIYYKEGHPKQLPSSEIK